MVAVFANAAAAANVARSSSSDEEGPRWLSSNPSKRSGELFFLAYTPLWIGAVAVLVAPRQYEAQARAAFRLRAVRPRRPKLPPLGCTTRSVRTCITFACEIESRRLPAPAAASPFARAEQAGLFEASPFGVHDPVLSQISPLALAYLGDSVYELYNRRQCLLPHRKMHDYHKNVVARVRAESQATHLERIRCLLTEDELDIVRRGRNASASGPKRLDGGTYQSATSLEALIGFLYLTNPQRLRELLQYSDPELEIPPPPATPDAREDLELTEHSAEAKPSCQRGRKPSGFG